MTETVLYVKENGKRPAGMGLGEIGITTFEEKRVLP